MALPEIIKDIDARVIRPTSTDNAIVRFNGTTGQIQNTANTIDDSNNTIINGNTTINGSISDTPLQIESKSDSTWIAFLNNSGTILGYLGLNSTGPAFYKDTTYHILHSGNYYNYALPLTGGTLTGQLVFNNNTSNQNGYPSIKWGTIQSNTPFIGYATDQSDGTFIITSLKGTTYATGLAIGGSSQDLLYKGQIILDASNFNQYTLPLTGGTLTGTLNITGGTFNYSSIQSGSSNANRNVWFSTSSSRGTPCFNDNFKYNPSTNTLTVGNITGNAASATILQTARTIFGHSFNGSANVVGQPLVYGAYTSTAENRYISSGIQVRENGLVGNAQSDIGYAPSIGFHWNGRIGGTLLFHSDGNFYLRKQDGTSRASLDADLIGNASTATTATNATNATNVNIANDTSSKIYVLGATTTGNTRIYRESSVYMQSDVLFGAAWNDYAEYRESNITQPGKCIIENGDDTLRLSTERLQRGAEIVSDTFGFAIGETDACKTPIAVSGRVLAYGYEDREQFKSHIGYPVCSGPNGTVSIMTDEEEQLYPSRIIGYISAVPDYEIWGTGNVKVDGRIWIRIK